MRSTVRRKDPVGFQQNVDISAAALVEAVHHAAADLVFEHGPLYQLLARVDTEHVWDVERNLRAIVRAHDVNGKEFELDATELTARCMLHETDHCDGIVFLDKMTPLKREIVKRRIKKLQKAGEWPS